MTRGFTLPELLIVLGIIALIAVLTVPTGISFLQTQTLNDVAGDLKHTLRLAQAYAFFQKNDDSYGVKIFSNNYVLFEGDSYATRKQDIDQVFAFAGHVTVSGGPNEIVFLQQSGTPNATGTILLSATDASETITIYENGNIE